jgi:flavin-dependent dehydrogenase
MRPGEAHDGRRHPLQPAQRFAGSRRDRQGLRTNRLHPSALARYERLWRKRLGPEIRVGLAFRRIAARLSDDSIDQIIELARVNGVIPLLQETASFNWHRKAAIALLTHRAFRRIVFKSLTCDGLI